jgi:hypothetical protein
VSVTAEPDPYVVEQPELPAEPPVIVQVIPVGFDCTAPLPPAPPDTLSANEFAGGENLMVIVRAALMVTWQARGFSVTAWSQPDQTAVPPPDGAAVTVNTIAAL